MIKMTQPKDGFFLVYKEPGITSSQLVQKLRKKLNIPKLGHTGTLDKFAEGLLILPTGRATFFSQDFLKLSKAYIAELEIGISTLSGDPESEIIDQKSISEIENKWNKDWNQGLVLKEQINNLIQWNVQDAPKISALKHHGIRYSDLTRQGIETPQKKRNIEVFSSKVLNENLKSFSFEVHVSSGTYIRQIAIDLSQILEFPISLKRLIRKSVGSYSMENAKKTEDLNWEDLLEILQCFPYKQCVLDEVDTNSVFHGRKIQNFGLEEVAVGNFYFVDQSGEILAICQKYSETEWKYLKVLH
ncbi:MAG: tRNA pseudouridine(55) synthase TruB [Leptospira sp.]|nr:tRNA pseudouridine(55) synthase TruB [Leptospira sp.]